MHTRAAPSSAYGYCAVALAAALWALSGTAAKFLFLGGVSPFALVQLRTTIAAVALCLWMIMRNRRLPAIRRNDVFALLILGLILAAAQFTYLFAISRIRVAAAILLQYQAPVLIALHAVFIAGVRPTVPTAAAIAGSVAGCYLVVGAYNLDITGMDGAGILSGLGSAVAFAAYSIRSERAVRTYSPWTVVWFAFLCAALAWNVIHPPLSAFVQAYSPGQWALILFIGIFGTVIPFGLFTEGINRIRPTHASITATLEPVIAGIIAYLLLGELLEGWQIFGACLVVAAIAALPLKRKAGEDHRYDDTLP